MNSKEQRESTQKENTIYDIQSLTCKEHYTGRTASCFFTIFDEHGIQYDEAMFQNLITVSSFSKSQIYLTCLFPTIISLKLSWTHTFWMECITILRYWTIKIICSNCIFWRLFELKLQILKIAVVLKPQRFK